MAGPTAPSTYRQVFSDSKGMLTPEIGMIGYDRFVRAQPGHLDAHAHAGFYEICYLVSGTVEWWNRDGLSEVHPGDVYFTYPGEVHGGADTVMQCCELYWMTLAMPRTFDESFRKMRSRVFKGTPAIRECLHSILQEHHQPGPHAAEFVLAKRDELLVRTVRASLQHDQATLPDAVTPPIRKAMDYLQQHATEDVTAESAAAVASLRPSRFHERFVTETGFTPLEYHARLRLLNARRLLIETSRPITRIAFDLGFSSSQYFATVFKNHLGLTPREYRDKHRNGT